MAGQQEGKAVNQDLQWLKAVMLRDCCHATAAAIAHKQREAWNAAACKLLVFEHKKRNWAGVCVKTVEIWSH